MTSATAEIERIGVRAFRRVRADIRVRSGIMPEELDVLDLPGHHRAGHPSTLRNS